MVEVVDSYRYLDGAIRRIVKAWIGREQPGAIPWTPLEKPLSECTVALVSSAGIALLTDRPFDQEGERKNPWWGDPSFRVIPRDAGERDIRIYHLHIDTSFGEQDLNCLLPLQPMTELEESGEIGRLAPSHYSFMGYILQPKILLEQSTPAMISQMRAEGVDVVLLVPV